MCSGTVHFRGRLDCLSRLFAIVKNMADRLHIPHRSKSWPISDCSGTDVTMSCMSHSQAMHAQHAAKSSCCILPITSQSYSLRIKHEPTPLMTFAQPCTVNTEHAVMVYSAKHQSFLLLMQNFSQFARLLAAFAGVAVPAAAVNSGLKYMQKRIQIAFMRRLSHHLHQQYCSNRAYYAASTLGGLTNADQRITEDVEKFAYNISELYSYTFKASRSPMRMSIPLMCTMACLLITCCNRGKLSASPQSAQLVQLTHIERELHCVCSASEHP